MGQFLASCAYVRLPDNPSDLMQCFTCQQSSSAALWVVAMPGLCASVGFGCVFSECSSVGWSIVRPVNTDTLGPTLLRGSAFTRTEDVP